MTKKIIKFKTKNCQECQYWQKTLERKNELCSTHEVYNPIELKKDIIRYQKYLQTSYFLLIILTTIYCFVAVAVGWISIFLSLLILLSWLFLSWKIFQEIKKDNQAIKKAKTQIKNEWIVEYE